MVEYNNRYCNVQFCYSISTCLEELEWHAQCLTKIRSFVPSWNLWGGGMSEHDSHLLLLPRLSRCIYQTHFASSLVTSSAPVTSHVQIFKDGEVYDRSRNARFILALSITLLIDPRSLQRSHRGFNHDIQCVSESSNPRCTLAHDR
jgi:hypothetical protein